MVHNIFLYFVFVQVEKRRDSLSILLPFADIAFIGKDFSEMKGATDCRNAVEIFAQQLPRGYVLFKAF